MTIGALLGKVIAVGLGCAAGIRSNDALPFVIPACVVICFPSLFRWVNGWRYGRGLHDVGTEGVLVLGWLALIMGLVVAFALN